MSAQNTNMNLVSDGIQKIKSEKDIDAVIEQASVHRDDLIAERARNSAADPKALELAKARLASAIQVLDQAARWCEEAGINPGWRAGAVCEVSKP